MSIKTDNSFHFRGKDVFGKSHEGLLKIIKKSLSGSKVPFLVFTPNPEQIMLAESDLNFNQVLKQADILVPDGVGLVVASKILSSDSNPKIEERIPGRLLVEDILKVAKSDNHKVLLIGGKDYSQTGKIKVNGVEIDWASGYLDAFNPSQGEEVALQKRIQQVKPDIVFVAFGAPMQEKWLVQHKEMLSKVNVKLGMAVGGSFDYLLGIVPSPPFWVSKMGFEWLFRLVVQPWRFKRQLKLINFMMLVLEERWQSM
jgi:N-acetylglucosaminyldiphosphoundecaprenol N-acetyl-beta-D-mannosaminyltransferase